MKSFDEHGVATLCERFRTFAQKHIIVAERSYWDDAPYANKRLTVPPSAKLSRYSSRLYKKIFATHDIHVVHRGFPRTKDSA